MALCATGIQAAFVPHTLASSHGLRQAWLSQNAEDGQSKSLKQDPGLRHPVVIGSPIRPSLQMQVNPPSLSTHLEFWNFLLAMFGCGKSRTYVLN